MTQLVPEQMLKVLHLRSKAECPEWTETVDEEVPHASSDEDPDDMVVQCPPRIVTTGDAHPDQAHRVVDHNYHQRERATPFVSGDREGHFGPCELRQPG